MQSLEPFRRYPETQIGRTRDPASAFFYFKWNSLLGGMIRKVSNHDRNCSLRNVAIPGRSYGANIVADEQSSTTEIAVIVLRNRVRSVFN